MANVSSSIRLYKCPQLRFPEYNQDWQYHHLQDCADSLRERSEISKSKFVSTENMLQNCEGIEPYTDNNLVSGIKFAENDILLANIRPYLKKLWKATFNGVCSADVIAFHPHSISADFLYYILSNDKFFTYVMSGVKGSKMPRGDKKHIMTYEFFIPTTSEQNKISRFLDLLMLKIRKQQELLTALKSYKRGVLQSIKVPTKTYCVGRIFNITRGYVLPTRNVSEQKSNSNYYPVYSSQTKNDGLMGYFNQYLYENAITWTTDGANAGYTRYREGKFYCTNVCGVLLNDAGYANEFVAEKINEISKKYVSYVGNPKLMNNVMAEIKIDLPTVEKQQHYSKLIALFNKMINYNSKILENLAGIKRSLLQQLFI